MYCYTDATCCHVHAACCCSPAMPKAHCLQHCGAMHWLQLAAQTLPAAASFPADCHPDFAVLPAACLDTCVLVRSCQSVSRSLAASSPAVLQECIAAGQHPSAVGSGSADRPQILFRSLAASSPATRRNAWQQASTTMQLSWDSGSAHRHTGVKNSAHLATIWRPATG